jgi:GH43 family beta-xylosidase
MLKRLQAFIVSGIGVLLWAILAVAHPQSPPVPADLPPIGVTRLGVIRMRDVCILPDPTTRTYYMIASAGRGVRAYTSRDLSTWEGPHSIFRTPENFWPETQMRGIWAPELHRYRDKYYLFLTFDTATKLAEQWRNWLPRVRRGSQVLVADAPLGPFAPFAHRPTLPEDMMTLDGTLWVEDGVPYMVFCHEWVQIKDGTIDYVRLKDDLSETIGEPVRLFDGSDAGWSKKSEQYGCHVTDGPYLYKSKSGKLFMIWSTGGSSGYTTGMAVSDSGKLAGAWRQQAEPIFDKDGGHGMLFTAFDGKLMMVLHSPNDRAARPRIFEMEDTGETLRIRSEFTGENP